MRRHLVLALATFPEPDRPTIARSGVRLAAHLDGDLEAITFNVGRPFADETFSRLLKAPEVPREIEDLGRAQGAELVRETKDEAAKLGVNVTSSEVSCAADRVGATMADHVRLFDFALIGWKSVDPFSRGRAEAIIFGSGRPVVLLPELSPVQDLHHVAIAWDGSRAAARALADAHPFLQRASRVTILTVVGEKPLADDPAKKLQERLTQVGLPAVSVSIEAEDCPIGTTLQDHAAQRGAGILVMGAFGHSRLRDFVLGGATQSTLRDLRLATMLSH